MRVRVKAEIFGGWPMWGIWREDGLIRVDRYDRKAEGKNGLEKEELLEILKSKGYEVLGRQSNHLK